MITINESYLLADLAGSSGLGAPILVPNQQDQELATHFVVPSDLADRLTTFTNLVIGFAYYNIEDYQNAMLYFEKVASDNVLKPEQRKESLYSVMGDIAVQNEDYSLARDFYQEAIDINPQYAPVYVGLGNLYYIEAISEEIRPDLVHLAIDEYALALSVVDRPLGADLDARAHFGLGNSYTILSINGANGFVGQAINEFQFVIEDYESGNESVRNLAAEAHAKLGLIYTSNLYDVEHALVHYRSAFDLIDDPARKEIFQERVQELEELN